MYVITHSHIAKNVPLQNPPSNVNPYSFSNHRFWFLLVDIHISKARVVSDKVRRSYTTFWVWYNCHRFLPHVSTEHRSCDITWNHSIVFLCVFNTKTEETIRMQILAYFVSLFYHLNEFLKMVSWVFIPPKLNIYTSG